MTENEMVDAYKAGFGARLRGDALAANPHAKDTPDHERWAAGWMDQDQQIADVKSLKDDR